MLKVTHIKWAPSSEFVSSSIPSLQISTAHAQPFRGARDLIFCLKVPLDSLLVWASSEGSGETARMRRLAWTFAARIGDKYQIRLTRSKCAKSMNSWEWATQPYSRGRGGGYDFSRLRPAGPLSKRHVQEPYFDVQKHHNDMTAYQNSSICTSLCYRPQSVYSLFVISLWNYRRNIESDHRTT